VHEPQFTRTAMPMASDEEDVHSPAAEGEPASKRARSADEDDAHNETDAAGSASTDMRQHWVDLDGCQTLQDVQKVLHTRFQTSQQLLDYIQTYRDTRLLKIIPLLMERPRHKLPHVNSLDHVCDLVSTCKNILVLTGAGVSVSAGIPDFRSSDGIYRRLRDEVRHLRPFATPSWFWQPPPSYALFVSGSILIRVLPICCVHSCACVSRERFSCRYALSHVLMNTLSPTPSLHAVWHALSRVHV